MGITRRNFLSATAVTVGGLSLEGLARADALIEAPLRIASEDYPPYAFNLRGSRHGFDVEKVTMVLDALRHRFIQTPMMRTALFQGLDEATVDLGFPFTETPVRLQKYIVAAPLHTNRTAFAMRTSDVKGPIGLDSIAGLRVGVTDRHRYPAAFDAMQNITRVSCSSLNLAIRRLDYERVDAVIGDLSAMKSIVSVEGLEHKITVSTNAIGSANAFVLFPQSRHELAAAFTETLARLQAEGKFKDLEARFPTVEPPR